MEQIIYCYNALDYHNFIYGLIEHYNKPKVDVIVTSPPYNIGTKYSGYIDNIPINEWEDLIIHSLHPTDKICNEGALMYLNLKPNHSNNLQFFKSIMKILTEIERMSKWKFVQDIIWYMPNKQQINPTKFRKRFSSYKEYIFLFSLGRYEINKAEIGKELSDYYIKDKRYEKSREKMKKEFGKLFKDRGDVWEIPILKYNQSIKRFNPAEFPPELPETCIKTHPKYGKEKMTVTVYDPFMGGGTTAVVAAKMGYNFYGCDISKSYVEATKKRVRKYGRRNINKDT